MVMVGDLHKSVLLEESIEYLSVRKDGIYVDATFGRGGHSQEILSHLSPSGSLYVIDKDPEAILVAKSLQEKDNRLKVFHGSYSQIKDMCDEFGILGKVNGIVADLGVSSPQLDEADRGFSFTKDGPLDMRMNTAGGITAKQWLAEAKEEDIANTIYEYGEERFSRRIARNIVSIRQEQEISTTLQLAEIVSNSIPRKEKHKHPATRTFQAIRIKINNELKELEDFLISAFDVLEIGGRLTVISFHSLEDKIVKRFFARLVKGDYYPKDIPIPQSMIQPEAKKIGKAVRASAEEIDNNVRARSAIMRTIEKLGDRK